jgi:hypothetical protein
MKAPKDLVDWILIAGVGVALYWLVSSQSSAGTGPTTSTTSGANADSGGTDFGITDPSTW